MKPKVSKNIRIDFYKNLKYLKTIILECSKLLLNTPVGFIKEKNMNRFQIYENLTNVVNKKIISFIKNQNKICKGKVALFFSKFKT